MGLDFLYHYLNQIAPIDADAWGEFTPILNQHKYDKGDFLQKVGETADSIAFVINGSFRYFYIKENGEEFNHAFRFEGEVAACYSSLLRDEPCRFSVQSMEEAQTLEMLYTDFCKITDKFRCFERLEKIVTQKQFITKEKRQVDLLMMSATERYLELLKEHPGIEKRVPQFHLASYIGVAPSSLNRIIKSL